MRPVSTVRDDGVRVLFTADRLCDDRLRVVGCTAERLRTDRRPSPPPDSPRSRSLRSRSLRSRSLRSRSLRSRSLPDRVRLSCSLRVDDRDDRVRLPRSCCDEERVDRVRLSPWLRVDRVRVSPWLRIDLSRVDRVRLSWTRRSVPMRPLRLRSTVLPREDEPTERVRPVDDRVPRPMRPPEEDRTSVRRTSVRDERVAERVRVVASPTRPEERVVVERVVTVRLRLLLLVPLRSMPRTVPRGDAAGVRPTLGLGRYERPRCRATWP
jgi:hypothetical protein